MTGSSLAMRSTGCALLLATLHAVPARGVQDPTALRIDDVSIGFEGNSGSNIATFTVRRDSAGTFASVQYTTVAGTASGGNNRCGAGTDFLNTSGTISFAGSEKEKQILVTTCGDREDEPTETFSVNLFGAAGATLADATGTATILDDDPPPSLRVGNVTVAEGNANAQAAFAVVLSEPSGFPVTVSYATRDGSARAGTCGSADYVAASGQLSFAPGVTQQTAPVTICGDAVHEGDQTFTLQLSAATNANIPSGTATATIQDDDAVPSLGVKDVIASEGVGPGAVFTVFLNGITERQVTVQYATAPGSAVEGTSCRATFGSRPGDYVGQSGTFTFPANGPAQQQYQIVVPICTDTNAGERDETFTLTLVRAAGANISHGVATGTIR